MSVIPECDICGLYDEKLKRTVIEGTLMNVCEECSGLGRVLPEPDPVKEEEIKEFSVFNFTKELTNIEDTLKEEEIKKDKYSIIKDLVKHVSS